MNTPKRFHERLRESRIAVDKSMGEVARGLGITTAYYSEVENGRRPPFPTKKVNYEILGTLLGVDAGELLHLGSEERGRIEINLRSSGDNGRSMAIQLARRLNDGSLTEDEAAAISKILEGKK